MPVGIGGIGDIVALLKIVQGFAVALDGSRGAAAEYQEVKRELEGLEAALRCHEGNNQLVVAVNGIQEELRLGWLGNCLTELKEMVSQIFITTGTTLSATQRIETILLSRSQKALIQTFTFEDALGRITQWDLVYISSWDALDAMIEICFRDLPGHEKVARKEYVFQDERTNREIKRSTPWPAALLPDQHINMGLLFRKRSSKNKRFWCPYCHLEMKQSQEGRIPCKCGMSHQRRSETVDINEDEDMPAFDLFDVLSSNSDDLHESSGDKDTLMVAVQDEKCVNFIISQEDMSVFKRVIVVEVELNFVGSAYRYPDFSDSESDVDESVEDTSTLPQRQRKSPRRPRTKKTQPPPRATEADARMHHIPPGYSLKNWDPAEEPIKLLGSVFDCNSLGKWILDWTVYYHGPAAASSGMARELRQLLIGLSNKIKRAEECMPRIRKEDNRYMIDDFITSGETLMGKLKKLLKSCEGPMLKACGWRAPKPKRDRSDQEPNSVVLRDVGVDQLGGKLELSAQPEPRSPLAATNVTLKPKDSNSANTISAKALKTKHDDAWGSWGSSGQLPQVVAPKKSGLEFVDSIFGRDRYLDATEKFMSGLRLWHLRFDANCEDIIRRPDE